MNCSLLTAGLVSLALFAGCASEEAAKDKNFHTSGNREADQRAEQMIAKDQQIRGEAATGDQSDVKPTLYARLGQDEGIKIIVSDWVDRALADPRVNWKRLGVTSGGVLGVGAKSETWTPTPATIEQMKKHIVQFIALATGGPAQYDGHDMGTAHKGMAITNDEFSAAIGDLNYSLDAHKVAIDEKKELIAIVESTRTQIVEEH